MTNPQPLCAGFTDPVHDAQRAFRRALDGLAHPGRPYVLGSAIAGLKLGPAMGHLLLALTDDDTPVWWQKNGSSECEWLRFHTGGRPAAHPGVASFAVLTDAEAMPLLSTFALGSPEAPEKSATLLIEVPSLEAGAAIELRGPGIQESQTVRIAGLADGFWAQWQGNHAAFPQGVDIIFTCADKALGLPRTTRVRRLEGL